MKKTLKDYLESPSYTHWREGELRIWDRETLLKQSALAGWLSQDVVMMEGSLFFRPNEERAYYQKSLWQPMEKSV